jgi:hypothetical protein
MDSWTRTYLGSLFMVLVLISVSPAQNDSDLDVPFPPQADLDLTDVIVDVEASDVPADVVQAALPNVVVRMVRLMYDGSLQGRVRIIFPTGKTVPANAEIAFKQSGKVLGATKTNGEGIFEVASLPPGRYTATVSIEAGSTDFQVNVLPYDSEANADQMMLNATLTPTPEIVADETLTSTCPACGGRLDENGICEECGEEVIVEEYVEEMPAECCGGFSGGGCCGGGGGGMGLGLVGLAGLAGLAGINNNNNNHKKVASPHAPH